MHDVDPEVAAGLEQVFGTDPEPAPAVGDWLSRRLATKDVFDRVGQLYPGAGDVDSEDLVVDTPDGPLTLRRYRKRESQGAREHSAAVLYLHGGGMFMCDLDTHDGVCRDYASATGLQVVSVGYRLAPEHPFPAPLDDCYLALRWLSDHAEELGVDQGRLIVAGESAGGGLAAAVALMARDRGGPAVAGQLLIYPMLDRDTVQPDSDLEQVAIWSYDDHRTAWGAYLGGSAPATAATASYAMPLQAADLTGLPPTYLEVGELDIFRAECLVYAQRLSSAGVPLEFHLHPRVPHAFEVFAPAAAVSRRAMADRYRVLRHWATR